MEVCVILLRSIRRRLVTGFTVALVLLLIIAGAAVWGLVQHQAAVDRLRHVVSERPNPDKLKGIITTIQCPLYEIADFLEASEAANAQAPVTVKLDDGLNTQTAAIRRLRKQLDSRVAEADQQVRTFLEIGESEAVMGEFRRSGHVRATLFQGRIRAIRRDLGNIKKSVQELDVFGQNAQRPSHAVKELGLTVAELTSKIVLNLDQLPQDTYVVASLDEEIRNSQLLTRRVWIAVGIAVVTYAITILCAFKWVANPLRAISRGASRIANGDTNYRLSRVTRWEDEFFDLTTNFNRMADRFIESENDLAAKVEDRSRQLVRSERLASVGCLAAGVAHEINNPLSAITIAAQSVQYRLSDVLDPKHEDTDVVMERLSMIQEESKRCGEITRRLLDFSRNEKQEKVPNDLTRIIGEVLAMVRPMTKYHDRKIVFEQIDPLIIDINASQIKQVVLNLVTNGLQAASNNGEVEIRIDEQTDWVVIQIADNGEGMTSENLEQLFEPFYSTKETGEGTGLGLSITNRIVEEHNGTIEPFSAGSGRGSVFSVRLPRKQPAQKAA